MINFKNDFLYALKIAAISMVSAAAGIFLGGFLFGGFTLKAAVSVLRSGMCIISGLLLFLVGGTIIMKSKSVPDDSSNWRKRFKVLNYGSVIGIIAVFFIIGAVISDYICLFMF